MTILLHHTPGNQRPKPRIILQHTVTPHPQLPLEI